MHYTGKTVPTMRGSSAKAARYAAGALVLRNGTDLLAALQASDWNEIDVPLADSMSASITPVRDKRRKNSIRAYSVRIRTPGKSATRSLKNLKDVKDTLDRIAGDNADGRADEADRLGRMRGIRQEILAKFKQNGWAPIEYATASGRTCIICPLKSDGGGIGEYAITGKNPDTELARAGSLNEAAAWLLDN